jgi:hypothetical protein
MGAGKPKKPDPTHWDQIQQYLTLELNTKRFRDAWEEWIRFRKECKWKTPPTTISYQLGRLKKYGLSGAVRSIENSITGGWKGLFPPPTIDEPEPKEAIDVPHKSQIVLDSAQARWPKDFEGHPDDYDKIANLVYRGHLPHNIIGVTKARTGPEFRREALER